MFGRIIKGLGFGIDSTNSTVYISEVSPVSLRGKTLASSVILYYSGELMGCFTALGCGRNWRLMLGIAGIPAAI